MMMERKRRASGLAPAAAACFAAALSVRPWAVACFAAALSLWPSAAAGAEAAATALPENLAVKAKVAASSEFGGSYLARFAIDGRVPAAGSNADTGQVWAVEGAAAAGKGEFTLQWPQPVTVAEIVYYGRTAWQMPECWKDYEVYLDGAAVPAARGQFQMAHGAQRIKLAAPVEARGLRLKFLSSYGGSNPGASEIQVFGRSPSEATLRAFAGGPPAMEESADLARALAEGNLGFRQLLLIQRYPIDSTHVYTYHVEGFRAGGGLYALTVGQPQGGLRPILASPQGQILDADVSYDGQEILFSWRRGENGTYHVFSIRPDGTALRQLTDGAWHDYNACWLPDGGIAFLSSRSIRFAYCWISPVGLLHRMDRDGSNVRRLSANIVNDFTPAVMEDGRILYSRWEYVDKPAIPIQSLWTINPDGTGLVGFYGNRVLSPATFMYGQAIPGTGLVLCTLTAHNGPARGGIGLIDRSVGVNAQEAIRNLTPEIDIGQVDKGNGNHVKGPYDTPYPLDDRFFLVSKDGTVIVRDYAGTRRAVVIQGRDGMGFYSARPLGPRRRPPRIASSLPPPAEAEPWATVFVQDVYRGLEPQVARGEVKEICVVQEMEKTVLIDLAHRAFDFQFPVISCGATYAGKKVWGYAPVEADGSAHFRVPSGVPIYFMALDAQGRAVQRMRTFTHLMPGETQGCIGCHEPRTQASAVAAATLALRTALHKLRPPEWGVEGFDYSRVVQPVLDKHCGECHSGVRAAKKVDLSGDKTDFFSVSYETLARGRSGNNFIQWNSPYVSWIPTYNGHEQNILQVAPKTWDSPRSPLADLLLSGHPDAAGKPQVRLGDAERRRILLWIDLNVPYYGTSAAAYPDRQGARRLYPPDLDKTLADVGRRRCAECHKGGAVPRPVWTRITRPQLNGFLAAPLAAAAGGSEACGKPVFRDTSDPDYQAILKTFEPIAAMIRERPREDMPGAAPDAHVMAVDDQVYRTAQQVFPPAAQEHAGTRGGQE